MGFSANKDLRTNKIKSFFSYIVEHKYVYLLMVLPLAYMIIFLYIPMYGVTIAFKDFSYTKGITGSPWVGMEHFQRIFSMPKFYQVLWNTLKISLGRLILEFPMPIILALLLNEITKSRVKKVFQTVFTFPNFISWVVVSGMIFTFFSSDGFVNQLLQMFGKESQNVLTQPNQFLAMLFISNIWKTAGWGSIIYLSALSSVDPSLYEAANVDGASAMRQMWSITLPSIMPTIVVVLILNVANIMNAGFDQIFNLYNPLVYDTADILDTYVYRLTFAEGGNFSFSTAVGLFKSVINMILLISVDKGAKALGQPGLY